MHLQINPPADSFVHPGESQNASSVFNRTPGQASEQQERLNYIAESESFNHEFLLPKSYDMPSVRERPLGPGTKGNSSPVTPDRCKLLPETVLFYIFYSMPFDHAQLNASHELKRRSWFYSDESMRWMKAVEQHQSPNPGSTKAGVGKKGRNTSKN